MTTLTQITDETKTRPTVVIEINGQTVEAAEGEMLLDAMRRAGVNVPTLCYIKGLPPSGACRMCVVEIEDRPGLVPSCAMPVVEGMTLGASCGHGLPCSRSPNKYPSMR